jgi:hypothetical protein
MSDAFPKQIRFRGMVPSHPFVARYDAERLIEKNRHHSPDATRAARNEQTFSHAASGDPLSREPGPVREGDGFDPSCPPPGSNSLQHARTAPLRLAWPSTAAILAR